MLLHLVFPRSWLCFARYKNATVGTWKKGKDNKLVFDFRVRRNNTPEKSIFFFFSIIRNKETITETLWLVHCYRHNYCYFPAEQLWGRTVGRRRFQRSLVNINIFPRRLWRHSWNEEHGSSAESRCRRRCRRARIDLNPPVLPPPVRMGSRRQHEIRDRGHRVITQYVHNTDEKNPAEQFCLKFSKLASRDSARTFIFWESYTGFDPFPERQRETPVTASTISGIRVRRSFARWDRQRIYRPIPNPRIADEFSRHGELLRVFQTISGERVSSHSARVDNFPAKSKRFFARIPPQARSRGVV